ncbi:MAG: carboxymuconolactone decarboxylase family protein [Acidimicrobiia bacterium]
MSTTPPHPSRGPAHAVRIPPLPEDQRDSEMRDLLAAATGSRDRELNIFSTLVRHPRLFRRWLGFGGELLLNGLLPARDRELLILRTAWNCGAEYEWGQHLVIARDAGVSDEEIEAVAAGPDAPGWSAEDARLLRAADELHTDARIGDTTWAGLAARYDEPQLIELTMLVGQYHLVAFALNSCGVEREPGVEGFAS